MDQHYEIRGMCQTIHSSNFGVLEILLQLEGLIQIMEFNVKIVDALKINMYCLYGKYKIATRI